jgi:putative DNA primase/helicase
MSSAENYDEVIATLNAAGLRDRYEGGPISVLEFAKFVRCRVDDDRERRGWYLLYETQLRNGALVIFGSYGIFRGNNPGTQKIELERRQLSDDEREAIRARIAEDKRRAEGRRKAEIERAAAAASAAWEKCSTSGECDYLTRKKIGAHGVRFTERSNLVIPMLDERQRIRGLQIIYSAAQAKKRRRDREYWPRGMTTKGLYCPISSPVWLLLLCEGYATGAALHEATGYPVAVAFDAGNLLPVAQALRKRYPWALRILVCADDDYLAKCKAKDCEHVAPVDRGFCPKCNTPYGHGNAGVESAAAAALSVDGGWVKPTFITERQYKITDFNDLFAQEGPHPVRSQIEAKLIELGWNLANSTARGGIPEGGGDKRALKSLLTVDEAAMRYSLVYGGRGTLFDHQEHELVPKNDVLDLLEDRGWGDWKRHRNRRVVRVREVGFDPAETDTTIRCNLWGGWPTTPQAGTCTVLLELLEYLCSDEHNSSEIYKWVLNWLAYPIQYPGAKMKSALVFHGPQGVGKNMFFEAVMSIYGQYGDIVDQAALESDFNDWASKKLFLIADEVVARQELFHTKNKLKGLITGDIIRINPKNVAAHIERNHLNIVFLSNEIQPLVPDKDDRRYAVVYTPPGLRDQFYKDITAEINAGAIAALHDHLLKLDLGEFKPWTRPPMTKSKQDLIAVSLDSIQRFLREWEDGETPYPFGPAASMDLYRAYLRWCRDNGVTRPRESSHFLGYIGKLRNWSNMPRHIYTDAGFTGGTRSKRIVVPDEAALARAKKAREETDSMAKWLTVNVLDFAMSLEDQGRGKE